MSAATAEVLTLAASFQQSFALASAVELKIPEAIRDGALTTAAIATAVGIPEDSANRLLRALATIGYFEQDHATGRWRNTEKGEATIAVRDTIVHLGKHCAPGWLQLSDSLKTQRHVAQQAYGHETMWAWLVMEPERVATFNANMQLATTRLTDALITQYDWSQYNGKLLCDVGGGRGHLAGSIISKHPEITGVCFDLPEVVEEGKKWASAQGFDNLSFEGGSFFERVPNADVITLGHIIHDWNNAKCLDILESCRNAIANDGTLLIVDLLVPDDVSKQQPGEMFRDLHCAVLIDGRERTREEFSELLAMADFELTRVVPIDALKKNYAVIEAKPVSRPLDQRELCDPESMIAFMADSRRSGRHGRQLTLEAPSMTITAFRDALHKVQGGYPLINSKIVKCFDNTRTLQRRYKFKHYAALPVEVVDVTDEWSTVEAQPHLDSFSTAAQRLVMDKPFLTNKDPVMKVYWSAKGATKQVLFVVNHAILDIDCMTTFLDEFFTVLGGATPKWDTDAHAKMTLPTPVTQKLSAVADTADPAYMERLAAHFGALMAKFPVPALLPSKPPAQITHSERYSDILAAEVVEEADMAAFEAACAAHTTKYETAVFAAGAISIARAQQEHQEGIHKVRFLAQVNTRGMCNPGTMYSPADRDHFQFFTGHQTVMIDIDVKRSRDTVDVGYLWEVAASIECELDAIAEANAVPLSLSAAGQMHGKLIAAPGDDVVNAFSYTVGMPVKAELKAEYGEVSITHIGMRASVNNLEAGGLFLLFNTTKGDKGRRAYIEIGYVRDMVAQEPALAMMHGFAAVLRAVKNQS